MLESLKYINHQNESLEFGKGRLFVNENDLRDFSWSVISKNDRISGFNKGIVEKTIPVVIKCENVQDGAEIRNRLFEVLEKDVLATKHGKIVIGDYYMKCFAVASEKSSYLLDSRYMIVSLKITTDFPYWIKETKTIFGVQNQEDGKNLDFNRDFPWDYTSNLLGNTLNNTNFTESDFRLLIHGACNSPVVTIGGHEYGVNVLLQKGEYITIDSVEKTIIRTRSNGIKDNCFNLRNKESYIFEKIPVGISNVSTNGAFQFEVIVLDGRSEPKWI